MVSTRNMASKRMSEAEQMTLLMSLQREMVEMRRRNGEAARKNENEILALRKENEKMKRKLSGWRLSVGLTNLVGRSFTTPTGFKTVEEPKDKIHTQEVDESPTRTS